MSKLKKAYQKRKKLKKTPFLAVHNPGPYSQSFDGPQGDRASRQDFQKVFDNFDDSSAHLPSVTIFGQVFKIIGKCATCQNPLFYKPSLAFCPRCKRNLAVSSPMDEFRQDVHVPSPSETTGMEKFINDPSPGNALFDVTKHNLKVPGDLY